MIIALHVSINLGQDDIELTRGVSKLGRPDTVIVCCYFKRILRPQLVGSLDGKLNDLVVKFARCCIIIHAYKNARVLQLTRLYNLLAVQRIALIVHKKVCRLSNFGLEDLCDTLL